MPFEREETRPAAGRRDKQDDGSVADGFDGLANFDPTRLSNALGWFSIGLGLAGALSPRSTARMIGAADNDTTATTLQLVGVRELISGIGLLSNPEAPGWAWSRVAGDVVDLALLGTAFTADRADPTRLSAATAAVAGITFLDLLCAERLTNQQPGSTGRAGDGASSRAAGLLANAGTRVASSVAEWTGNRPIHVVSAITINASAEKLYDFWRNVENLPRVMHYLDSVQPLDNRRSHWRARGPLDSRIEWESEITDDAPGQRIGWRSRPGAAVDNRGIVMFKPAPGKRGTIVEVTLDYRPPGRAAGAAFAKLLGRAPDQQAEEDLRRLKQIFEIGEILESDATAKGWGAGRPSKDVPDRVRGRTMHGADPVISSAQGSPV